jgi:hypothetical protein
VSCCIYNIVHNGLEHLTTASTSPICPKCSCRHIRCHVTGGSPDIRVSIIGGSPLLSAAYGACMGGIPGLGRVERAWASDAIAKPLTPSGASAQGALVVPCGIWVVGAFELLIKWLAVWADGTAAVALGSWFQLNSDPNGRCWLTGNFDLDEGRSQNLLFRKCSRLWISLNDNGTIKAAFLSEK